MKKKILLWVALLMSSSAFAQNYNNWAIGVKVGEPVGLNIRKYFDSGRKNFDVNFGTYGFLWGATRSHNNKPYYKSQTGLMVQGIFHWNNQIGSAERFQIYYGFGGQINSRKRVPPVSNNVPERHISLGGVADAGMEYSLPNNNLSIFAELGIYAEIAPKPLFIHVPGSIGVRLNLIN